MMTNQQSTAQIFAKRLNAINLMSIDSDEDKDTHQTAMTDFISDIMDTGKDWVFINPNSYTVIFKDESKLQLETIL